MQSLCLSAITHHKPSNKKYFMICFLTAVQGNTVDTRQASRTLLLLTHPEFSQTRSPCKSLKTRQGAQIWLKLFLPAQDPRAGVKN